MKFLVDTHVLLWLLNKQRSLPRAVASALLDESNECFLSIASLWEMTIKASKKQLTLPGGSIAEVARALQSSKLNLLGVDVLDLPHLEALSFLHRDPFDRVLIAQAIRHNLILVTIDTALEAYGVPILWN